MNQTYHDIKHIIIYGLNRERIWYNKNYEDNDI